MRARRLALILLVTAALGSRFLALTRLPIFVDESVHLLWARAISHGEELWKPWGDGKLLSIWVDGLALRAGGDALWTGRAVSVAFGGVSVVSCVALGSRLFGSSAGLLAGVFAAACPFAYFYDRMALVDGPLAAMAALTLLASVALARDTGWRPALALAACLTGAVLTKASGLLLFAVPLVAALLLRPRRLAPFVAASAGAALAVAWPVARFLGTTPQLDKTFAAHPDASQAVRLAWNAQAAAAWTWIYWTPALGLLALVGLGLASFRRSREALLLVIAAAIPVVAFVVTSSVWFPRYLLFATVPVVLLAAYGLEPIRERFGTGAWAAVAVLALLPALRLDAQLLQDPAHAPLPAPDRLQYINGWPSGYGVRELVPYFAAQLREHPGGITVVTHALARRTNFVALQLYLGADPAFDLLDMKLDQPASVTRLREQAAARPTFVVLSPLLDGPSDRRPDAAAWSAVAELELETAKPDGRVCNQVYRVKPSR